MEKEFFQHKCQNVHNSEKPSVVGKFLKFNFRLFYVLLFLLRLYLTYQKINLPNFLRRFH